MGGKSFLIFVVEMVYNGVRNFGEGVTTIERREIE